MPFEAEFISTLAQFARVSCFVNKKMDLSLFVVINGSGGMWFLVRCEPLCSYEWVWRYGVLRRILCLCVVMNGPGGMGFLGGSVPLAEYEWVWKYGVLRWISTFVWI